MKKAKKDHMTASVRARSCNRWAFGFLAACTQLWLACTGPSPLQMRDAGRPMGAAGSAADGGTGGEGGEAGARSEAGGEAGGEAAGAEATDAGASGAAGDHFVPAAHAPFPLVTDHGGPVIQNIELVPVYFGDDPLRVDLERFNTWIVASDYWQQAGLQYGVHAGTRLPARQFPDAASPLSDDQIVIWLNDRVSDGSLPKPSANTVFALFYQAGTTLTTATGTSCSSFGALHETASLDNKVFTGNVPVVLVPRCSYSTGDELMVATDVASHEYMEAATNAQPLSNPGWTMDNATGPLEAWGILSGPAVADLCLNQSYDEIDGFFVNDIWSNAAAQAGQNPCQPSDPSHPFFTVSADMTIYHAQPGSTLTIHARAWSNMAAPDWSLGINWGLVPYSDFDGQAALSRTLVNNGDDVTATVTVPTNPPVVDGRSVYRFTIDSIDPINPNFSHPWPFLVVVP